MPALLKKAIVSVSAVIVLLVLFPLTAFAEGPFTGGDGTSDNPYQIETPEQLNSVRNYTSSFFILNNDIDLEAATSEGGLYYNDGAGWMPIGTTAAPFNGNFNGNGHKIEGIRIERPKEKHTGLFGMINNASISNTGISRAHISGLLYAGGIAGEAKNSRITGCHNISGYVESNFDYGCTGGIAGVTDHSEITLCYNASIIFGQYVLSNNGGVAGKNGYGSRISACYNTGDVGANTELSANGGICGENNAVIEDCFNTGYIQNGTRAGIAGQNTTDYMGNPAASTIRCYNLCSVSSLVISCWFSTI